MKPPIIYLFVQHTCPEFPSILPNRVHFRYIQQHPCGLRAHWSTYVLSDTLAITAQTKVTRGRLSLIRLEYHKEQICRCGRCASLLWVISMAQRVPAAGLCPKILFRIVTRSLACFSRALGCCVRRLKTPAIPALIFPCSKLLYARDSFWHFPLATHCTACTQNNWSCNPRQAAPQKDLQGSMRNMQGTMMICWLFGLPSTQKLCTNQPHVPCPCSNLSESRDPFSSKTFSVNGQATNGKKSHLLHLLLLIYMNCQDDHNTMRTM